MQAASADSTAVPPDIGPFRYVWHPTWTPQARAGDVDNTAPVTIAGGGPVGLALALGLARHGVRSVVLEADNTVCVGSRAICISRRSLQIMERLGVLPSFLAKGLPWTSGRSYYKTDEVFRFEMPHDAGEALPPMINLQQYYIEQFLLDGIAQVNDARPGCIDLRWGNELVGFTQDAAGVDVQVRAGDAAYSLRTEWLAACDGGQSFVRKSLGLELRGAAYEGRYVIVDIELRSGWPTERRAWFDPPWHRGSTVLMHKQPDDIWRIDYQLLPGETAEEALRPEAVKAFVQRHLDGIGEGHLAWRPVWSSVYRAGAMTLESYRHGRILFAGNAAHALPIFGVRGLNSGFDDADNLAWKLALVVRGASRHALLNSYSDERLAAFRVNAENAMRSTEFMSPPSRGFDLLREAALSLALRHRNIAKLVNPRQTQAVSYPGSVLSCESDVMPAGPCPGDLLPNLEEADSQLLSPDGFTVLELRPTSAALVSPDAWRDLRIDVKHVVRGSASAGMFTRLAAADGGVYLVRPDGYVAGRWRRPSQETLRAAIVRAADLEGETR